MRIFKHILPFAAGLALFLALNAVLDYMLIPYQFTRAKVHKIETETFDDLFLGSSHGASAFDPSVIQEGSGRSSFNACAGGQFPMDNYYLLLDAVREHQPKRVIFEYDPAYWINRDNFNRTARYQESVMSPSAARLSYFRELLFPGDIRFVLMPWSLYDSGLSDISRIVAMKQTEAYKTCSFEPFSSEDNFVCDENGYARISDTATGDWKVPDLTYTSEMERIVSGNRDYFEKIARLCRDRGIELLVVTTPVPSTTFEKTEDFYRTSHNWMHDLKEKYGFQYLDFVLPEENEVAVPDLSDVENFSDAEGHMRAKGAGELCGFLAGL